MSKYYLKEYVTDLWKNSGLPQEAFSKELGIGYSTLKDALRGVTSLPQPSFLKALAKYEKIDKLEILKKIIYYNYLKEIAKDKDLNALVLYSCYLYTKDWSFINTTFEGEEIWNIDDMPTRVNSSRNIVLKKSTYPSRILFLDKYKAWAFVGKDRLMGIWSLLDTIEYKNKPYLPSYKSFDVSFIYDNNNKNIDFINKIEKEKTMLKAGSCNSVKFIIFDTKKYKIAKELVF